MNKNFPPRFRTAFFANAGVVAIAASLLASAHAQTMQVDHTTMDSTSRVNDITTRAWDTPMISVPQPRELYYIAGWNLGNIHQCVNHCSSVISGQTAWIPDLVASGNFQTDADNSYNQAPAEGSPTILKSALQARWFGWGGYMRDDDVPLTGVQAPTIRYGYGFSNPAPYPWKSTAPESYVDSNRNPSAKLVFEFYAAVPTYVDGYSDATSRKAAGGHKCIGFGQAGLALHDSVTNQLLTYSFIYFDMRGFNVAGGISESAQQVASGESVIRCIFANNTRYCTLLNQTPLPFYVPTASATSQAGTWTAQKYFAVSISREQLVVAVNELNTYINNNHPVDKNGHAILPFSTNPDNYWLGSVNVGMEGSLNPSQTKDAYGNLVRYTPLYMGFRGMSMKASTVY